MMRMYDKWGAIVQANASIQQRGRRLPHPAPSAGLPGEVPVV